MTENLQTKFNRLRDSLKSAGSVAVAFSGGVDSTLLLKAAVDALGARAIAITMHSEFVPLDEIEEAKAIASKLGVRHEVLHVPALDIPGLRMNPLDRCYHCKKALFTLIKKTAADAGIAHVAEGANADDANDFRPGARAMHELGVLTPLRDAGLTKAEIREISRELGLPTWCKPAYACLATRFPVGAELTAERLRMVELAERFLRGLGFAQCRVRHHGNLARIEVEKDKISDLLARPEIERRLKEIGFEFVTVDLGGYRMGSMSESSLKGKR